MDSRTNPLARQQSDLPGPHRNRRVCATVENSIVCRDDPLTGRPLFDLQAPARSVLGDDNGTTSHYRPDPPPHGRIPARAVDYIGATGIPGNQKRLGQLCAAAFGTKEDDLNSSVFKRLDLPFSASDRQQSHGMPRLAQALCKVVELRLRTGATESVDNQEDPANR